MTARRTSWLVALAGGALWCAAIVAAIVAPSQSPPAPAPAPPPRPAPAPGADPAGPPRPPPAPSSLAALESLPGWGAGGEGSRRELPSPVDAQLLAAANASLELPGDAAVQTRLALLLCDKAREVGGVGYYRRAEEAARRALAANPSFAQAEVALAQAIVGQHRFEEALVLAAPRADRARSVWRLACEFDCLFELGRYTDAVDAAQRLADLRPGLEALTRIALVREAHGDLEGAREMWTESLSHAPREGTLAAWTWAQLGGLELRHGEVARALAAYREALARFPGYLAARLGLARCEVAGGGEGSLDRALAIVVEACEQQGDLAAYALLADLQLLAGRTAEAQANLARARDAEERAGALGFPDPSAHAAFLADHDLEPERAVSLAREAHAARPTLAAQDALAWALLKAGRAAEAAEAARPTRRLGAVAGVYLYHEGAIELALGRRAEAAALLRRALAGGLAASPLQARRAAELLSRAE